MTSLVEKGAPMAQAEKLGEAVKRYGYAKQKKIKLYGRELELVSDPKQSKGDDVFVDAREAGSDSIRQVQVPRNVVQMAKEVSRNKK